VVARVCSCEHDGAGGVGKSGATDKDLGYWKNIGVQNVMRVREGNNLYDLHKRDLAWFLIQNSNYHCDCLQVWLAFLFV